MMTTKVGTTTMALKTTSRMKTAQAKRERIIGVLQPASRLLQRTQPSFLRLPYQSPSNSTCILRQDSFLALGHSAHLKVQIQQDLCCPDI